MATRIDDLIEQRRTGYTLPQSFYTDADVYQVDAERVFSQLWMLVGHVSQLQESGDYFLAELAGESIIVVCRDDNEIGAFYNVCRHRGSRICREQRGKTRVFGCPYHAWSYNLDGSLRAARLMPADFDKADAKLHPCHVIVFEGLIFISLAKDEPPEFEPALREIQPYVAPQKLANANVIHETVIATKANWKLVVENFWECYHCQPSHPEFAAVHGEDWLLALGAGAGSTASGQAQADYKKAITTFEARAQSLGHPVGALSRIGLAPSEFYQVMRSPLAKGCLSETQGGKQVAPLMGALADFDGGMTHVNFNPLATLYLSNDHAVVTNFRPMGAKSTEVHLMWLVDGSARANVDYTVDEVAWMWTITGLQDKTITENNQSGVNSRRYQPGPYSQMERQLEDFVQWYFARLQEGHAPAGRDIK